MTIAQALARRSSEFSGVVTCTPDSSLASLFDLSRMRRIHRLVVVEGGPGKAGETEQERAEREEKKGRLLGIISLSDVLKHVIVSKLVSLHRRITPAEERRLLPFIHQGPNVEIGGGGVGAVPVETVLAAEAKAINSPTSEMPLVPGGLHLEEPTQ